MGVDGDSATGDHGGGGTPLDSAEQRLRESEGRALEAIVQKCCMQVKLETPLDAASNASY
jgi:hypothetical protein